MRKALLSSSKEVYNLGGEKSIVYIVTQKVNNKRYYKEKLLCFMLRIIQNASCMVLPVVIGSGLNISTNSLLLSSKGCLEYELNL